MSEKLTIKPQNRWEVAVAGVVMQLLLGTVYAWSVFKKPFMAAHGWSNEQVGMAFTILIVFLGLAAAFGGKFVDKAGARKVATIAAILFGLGTILTGVADKMGSLAMLYIGYGVIGGIGNGLGYVTPVAVLVRWFPDKRGFITGLAVMGFGFGAAIMGQIAPLMIPKTGMIEGILSITEPGIGLANTFYIFGAVFLVVLLAAAQFLNNPPADWSLSANVQKKSALPIAVSVELNIALKMPQFYILLLLLFINVTAGIALISNLSPLAQDSCGISAVAAGTVILISSLFNGLGRILWSSLSDKLGRKAVFMLILGTQIPLFFILPQISNVLVFTIIACYILACYGGGFATMPAYAADTFGTKNMGSIYGKILLAWAAAGFVGPVLMEKIKSASGSFKMAIYVAAIMLAAGFVINTFYRKPDIVASKELRYRPQAAGVEPGIALSE